MGVQDDNLAQLAAAFNDHQITDDEGQIQGETETPLEDTALNEQTTEETQQGDTKTRETTEEPKPQDESTEEETAFAEDESGQKYVPQKRFDKVYGRMKEYERKIQDHEKQLAQGEELLKQPVATQKASPKPLPKTEAIEIEVLRMQMPEFDPTSNQYSQELDVLGGEIFRANPGITRLEAARRAKGLASSLTKRQVEAKEETRAYKAQNSDQGITNRVVSRVPQTKRPEDMSLEEMEAHLKATGQW